MRRRRKKIRKVGNVLVKSRAQLDGIRESGKINTAVLDYVEQHIHAGISTAQIDQWVYERTTGCGAVPAPLNYEGFPKSVCTSLNSVVCHGIPDEKTILKEGDIINVDVSTNYKGYYSDASRTFCIGAVSRDKKRLVQVAKEAVSVGLMQVKPWRPIGDMGHAVHMFVESQGYTVVEEIGGHGVGLEFHEDPWVSYVAPKGSGELMLPGMVFTIEPMINMGSPEFYVDESNGWTVYTEDGMPSAQWEVTVAVTEDGYEIMSW
ncbi:MAG: type I methionyl aminopeptidase [Lachnospiraceae bacterium]|nr:type I methionyl aminopeptidase [Lachnospiraceae bacterium]